VFQKILRSLQKRGKKMESPAPSRNFQAMADHAELFFGTDFVVMHEKASSVLHLDVYVIPPKENRPFWTLFTSGMSDLDLPIPDGLPFSAQIELAICLPPHWPLTGSDPRWKLPEFFWPIAELKSTAMYPHLCETWLGLGHSIEPADGALAGGRFAGHMLRQLTILPRGFDHLQSKDGRTIEILALCPLLPEEMAFKLNHSTEALESRLRDAGVTELLNPLRPPVCPAQ
jgi:hypothetical protein